MPEFRIGPPQLLVNGGFITQYPGAPTLRMYDVSPDGRRFLTIQSDFSEGVAFDTRSPTIIIVQNWFEELKERVPIP